jgi:hypothetical protein
LMLVDILMRFLPKLVLLLGRFALKTSKALRAL